MSTKILCIAVCLIMAIGFSPAFSAEKKVIVEGVGDNTPKGRQDAYNDALRKAIEKAVGTYVSVEMQVENREVIEENIYSRNEAYIKNVEVLKKWVDDDDLYNVKIQAIVMEGKLKDDIKAFRIIKKRKGNPRLMVIVKVEERNKHWYSNPDANGMRSKIERRLLRKKFKLVDISQVRNIQAIEMAAADGDAKQLKALAQRYGAEVIVTANATKTFSRKFTKYGRTWELYNFDIALKAVVADTAQMIYSNSIQEREKNDFTILYKHADTLTKEMINDIKEKWQSDVFNEATFELIVLNAEYNDILALQEAFGYSLGVNSVFERSFAEDTAVLEITFAGTAGQFGMLLADLEEPVLKVVGRSANKFKVEIEKEGEAVIEPAEDTTPPVITIISPKNGSVFGKASATITIQGTVDDPEVAMVAVGIGVAAVADGSFSAKVTLQSGRNSIMISGFDAAGNEGFVTLSVTLDTRPPKIRFKILNFEEKTFVGYVEPGAKLTVNGKPISVDKAGNFKIVLESVEEGEYVFIAVDAAGNKTERVYDY